VIVWYGVAASFAANALSYVAFSVALHYVSIVSTATEPAKRRSFGADLREGIRYTATHPVIASLLLLLTAIGIGGRPLNELLPGYAAQVFHSGAGGLSILASATGAGAIVAGLWLGHRAHTLNLITLAVSASVGGAVAAMAVSASNSMWLAVPCIAVFGFCVSTSGTAIQTVIQLTSDRSMRGRVMGLYGLIFRGAPAIGALVAGVASSHFGLRWPVFLGAFVVIATAIWTYGKRATIGAALARSDADA
jgi:predicted MFS family arabinose efflux permease